MTAPRLLILGGTTEGAELAERAVERFAGRLDVITSLAGRTQQPRPLPGRVRIGGFGGAEGLSHYLRTEAIAMLVDATHPFAAHISSNARRACARAGVPRLILQRAAWTAQPGDRWIEVADAIEAKNRVREFGQRAFLALGSGELAVFRSLRNVPLVVRVADAPARPPLAGAEIVVSRGPFDEREELRLLRKHRVAIVVSRNSGGDGAYGKIAAARRLGLPVIMISRPAPEPGNTVTSVDAALDWIAERLGA